VKGRCASFGQVNAGEESSAEFDLYPRSTGERQHVFQDKEVSKLAELERYQTALEEEHGHRDHPGVERREAHRQAQAPGH
jgi:hypothetical protein